MPNRPPEGDQIEGNHCRDIRLSLLDVLTEDGKVRSSDELRKVSKERLVLVLKSLGDKLGGTERDRLDDAIGECIQIEWDKIQRFNFSDQESRNRYHQFKTSKKRSPKL